MNGGLQSACRGHLGLLFLLLFPGGSSGLHGAGGAGADTEIQPPDVWVHVDRARQELEELRAFMGRPRDTQPELGITGAEPREVYFQALTLFRKADRFCFEQTRERALQEPRPPDGQIRPAHVFGVVDQALQRILIVKEQLALTKEVNPRPRVDTHTPSDVLRSIVQANRQLNLLLERQFAPSDVFQQVTVAIAYSERLLEQFEGFTTIPPEPAYEPNKRPADVYGRLLDAYDRVRRITVASGLKALEIKRPDNDVISRAAPSDVYDIASLMVSELSYLHAQINGAEEPRKVYYPGRKFPADVYQRTGVLEAQLASLEAQVSQAADWLRRVPGAAATP